MATSFAGIGEKDGDKTIGAVCPGVQRDWGSGADGIPEMEEDSTVEAVGVKVGDVIIGASEAAGGSDPRMSVSGTEKERDTREGGKRKERGVIYWLTKQATNQDRRARCIDSWSPWR